MTALLLLTAAGGTAWWAYRTLDRMPGELLRYVERRLYGHTRLESLALPAIDLLRARFERPVPSGPLPSLGKGAQETVLPTVRFDADGRPVAARPGQSADPQGGRIVPVSSMALLAEAMREARPGTVIEILPGTYSMRDNLKTGQAGTAQAPIVVRAAKPQSVVLQSSAMEGFIVTQPYWVFENLSIQGQCSADGNCEHAFHVVGPARSTVIRNNRLVDFNAHIKINGYPGTFPDNGLIQYNTLENTRRRDTHLPVTPIDLVAAARWTVADNLIANFIKGDGDAISYGLFMKGASFQGRIERNLLICTRQDISAKGAKVGSGARVGISLGGGGTGTPYCRDQQCQFEHNEGVVVNNVIAHCNDAGIDMNRAQNSIVAHNTLINTGWIDVRNTPSSAAIYGNWYEGRVRQREGGWAEEAASQTGSLAAFTPAPDALELRWSRAPDMVPTSRAATDDFCGRPRGPSSPPGAIGAEGLPCPPP
nr:hypothetical protein [Variovorax boronicumulans]